MLVGEKTKNGDFERRCNGEAIEMRRRNREEEKRERRKERRERETEGGERKPRQGMGWVWEKGERGIRGGRVTGREDGEGGRTDAGVQQSVKWWYQATPRCLGLIKDGGMRKVNRGSGWEGVREGEKLVSGGGG